MLAPIGSVSRVQGLIRRSDAGRMALPRALQTPRGKHPALPCQRGRAGGRGRLSLLRVKGDLSAPVSFALAYTSGHT